MAYFLYVIAYLNLAGYHLLAISYPDGAWSDDWNTYYASSARWFSATGPLEVGRHMMDGTFDLRVGTTRDHELARTLFVPADPYLGWGVMHAALLRVFSISPDTGFLILHLLGAALYVFSLAVFIQACFSDLQPAGHLRGLGPGGFAGIVMLLQTSYLGNPLLIGPAIFIPAMFTLPLAFLFLGLLPKPYGWIRPIILCAMIVIHSSGILVAVACLGASFLYRTLGTGSQASARERLADFSREVFGVGIFFFIMIAAAKLQWIPSLYPLSVGDFRLGWDARGASRVWRFIGAGSMIVLLWAFPFTLLEWRRSKRNLFSLPLSLVGGATIMLCSFGLLLLVQTWTRQQPALVRFLYIGWPVLLSCAFVSLAWLVLGLRRSRLVRILSVVAIVSLVAINLRAAVRFYRPLSTWRTLNNCRFLLEPIRKEILTLSKTSGDFVFIFGDHITGAIGFQAGAGDYPMLYSRLTPDWQERAEGFEKDSLFMVGPLEDYLNPGIGASRNMLSLESGKWKPVVDRIVSHKGGRVIESGAGIPALAGAAEELRDERWGCGGISAPVYRLLIYERVRSVGPGKF